MKLTRSYPNLHIDTALSNALRQSGGMLLSETVHTSGLGHQLKQALAAWKKPFATHDPAKILTDIAITLALGGEPTAGLPRPGNAGSNTAADHIRLVKDVLAGLPGGKARPGKSVLIRTDPASDTHGFLDFLTKRPLSYSVEWKLPMSMPDLYRQLTKLDAWETAYTDDEPRAGADVAEPTGDFDLSDWPDGMRVIVRRERPPPGRPIALQ